MNRYRYCLELLGNYSEPVKKSADGKPFIHNGLISFLQVFDSDLLLGIASGLHQIASSEQSTGWKFSPEILRGASALRSKQFRQVFEIWADTSIGQPTAVQLADTSNVQLATGQIVQPTAAQIVNGEFVQKPSGQIVQLSTAQFRLAASKIRQFSEVWTRNLNRQPVAGEIRQTPSGKLANGRVRTARSRRRTVNPRRHQKRIAPAVFNADRVMVPREVLQETFDRYLGFGNGGAE